MTKHRLLIGDVLEKTKTLDPVSIDLILFSPPYYGLRDYGVDGQWGLEKHPKEYIEKFVILGRELKRVLKKSGSMYIVLGDTYYGSGAGQKDTGKAVYTQKEFRKKPLTNIKSNWLQPKQLMLMPSRIAIALQDDNWVLRNDIIWNKPNAMPSSVKDRLANSYEHIFHFVQNRKYFYDLDSIRVPHSVSTIKRITQPTVFEQEGGIKQDILRGKPKSGHGSRSNLIVQGLAKKYLERPDIYRKDDLKRERRGRVRASLDTPHSNNPKGKNPGDVIATNRITRNTILLTEKDSEIVLELEKTGVDYRIFKEGSKKEIVAGGRAKEYKDKGYILMYWGLKGRNPGDLFRITTKGYKEAHFAVFPEALIIPIIKSSCPRDGIVLDPFVGSGTTMKVAMDLMRNSIGIELNPEYKNLIIKRIGADKFAFKEENIYRSIDNIVLEVSK
jgi:DNA modification methylase